MAVTAKACEAKRRITTGVKESKVTNLIEVLAVFFIEKNYMYLIESWRMIPVENLNLSHFMRSKGKIVIRRYIRTQLKSVAEGSC